MACKEIGEYCEVQQQSEKDNLQYQAIVLYRISEKIISEMGIKPKRVDFDTLFPEFKNNNSTKDLTEEQTQILIAEKWREFLKG